jgi:predicted acetyltransferase
LPIVIREYRDEDWPQVAAIWSLAFFGGEAVGRDHRLMRHPRAETYVAEDEEGLVGAANLIPMQLFCRGVELPAGGLAAVAVAPEHRRQGIGSSLLHWLLWSMRRRGMAISILHAIHAGFYRSFGYALAGRRLEFDCPLHLLPRPHEDLPIHRLTLDDWPELEPAYHAFARRYSGMPRREGLERCLSVVLAGTPPTIYAVGNPVEAYAILRLNPMGGAMQKAAETVWSTPRGWRALMEALSMLCINAASLSWCEPPDGPYLALHGERGVGIAGWLPPMYRIVDVPGALRALCPDASGSFTLAIDDELIPDNRGPWRVVFEPGRVHVEPASEAALTLTIGALTQALLGDPSLASLAVMGAVEVRDDDAFAAARRLLPPHPLYCVDFF